MDYQSLHMKTVVELRQLAKAANVRVPAEATMFYLAVTGKTGKLFDRQTVRATTGTYAADRLTRSDLC